MYSGHWCKIGSSDGGVGVVSLMSGGTMGLKGRRGHVRFKE
jgi:hypothetical protein